MNILVTGANGQLGREMRLLAADSPFHFVFSDLAQCDQPALSLDITDIEAVRRVVTDHDIDCIVNCAAYTDVEKAESDIELCRKVNATAPGILAQVMAERGGLLVHISTDYVFGAEPYNTPCREDQKGTPTGVYGLTKLEGEQAVSKAGCDSVILRTAWLYSEHGKNFVKTMLALTASKPVVKVVFDQAGTPTYALDLARAIMAILADYSASAHNPYPRAGVYHYSNEGVCSWYDFARSIGQMAGHTQCRVEPCHSDEFPSAVKRPAYSVLDKTKIKQTFGVNVPYWADSLAACLAAMQDLNRNN